MLYHDLHLKLQKNRTDFNGGNSVAYSFSGTPWSQLDGPITVLFYKDRLENDATFELCLMKHTAQTLTAQRL